MNFLKVPGSYRVAHGWRPGLPGRVQGPHAMPGMQCRMFHHAFFSFFHGGRTKKGILRCTVKDFTSAINRKTLLIAVALLLSPVLHLLRGPGEVPWLWELRGIWHRTLWRWRAVLFREQGLWRFVPIYWKCDTFCLQYTNFVARPCLLGGRPLLRGYPGRGWGVRPDCLPG